jgi:hypothetical protein
VGRRNYRYFVGFIISVGSLSATLSTSSLVLLIHHIITLIDNGSFWTSLADTITQLPIPLVILVLLHRLLGVRH